MTKNPIIVAVNPLQSTLIQQLAIKKGFCWAGDSKKEVDYIEMPYLVFRLDDKSIRYRRTTRNTDNYILMSCIEILQCLKNLK